MNFLGKTYFMSEAVSDETACDLSFYLAYLADPSGNKICAMHNIQS